MNKSSYAVYRYPPLEYQCIAIGMLWRSRY